MPEGSKGVLNVYLPLVSQINLMIDPEASKIALTADFPNITIAGNVANQVFPSQKFMDEVKTADNAYAQLFAKYYDLSFPFWDETAAALMVDPTIATNQTSGMNHHRTK